MTLTAIREACSRAVFSAKDLKSLANSLTKDFPMFPEESVKRVLLPFVIGGLEEIGKCGAIHGTQEKFGWFIGSKGERDLGVTDTGGNESEGAAPDILQQVGAIASMVLLPGAASD